MEDFLAEPPQIWHTWPMPMKLYTYYTESHAKLAEDWFLPSVQGDYDVIVGQGEQKSHNGDFKTDGWNATMLDKIHLILMAVKQTWGKEFVYADPDIQFFCKTSEEIKRRLMFKDMIIQRDEPKGDLCTGFLACRSNRKTLKLWQDAYRLTASDPSMDDQEAVNRLLCPNPMARTVFLNQLGRNAYGIRWSYLPNSYMGGGLYTGELWEPGKTLYIPEDLAMHHANFTKGVDNKIAQLQYVQDIVRTRRTNTK